MKRTFHGLNSQQVKESFTLHGDNRLAKEKKKGFIKRFIDNLSDPIIRVLIIALILQLIFTFKNVNWIELFGILSAILMSSLVSTISEYKSESAFEKIQGESENNYSTVLRDGRITKMPCSDIVLGDYIYISAGDVIPVDGEILDGQISVDQSALNGESAEVTKSVGKDNSWDLSSKTKVFRGTTVTNGAALVRTLRIGQATYFGMVAKDVQADTRVSPLKLRLTSLAKQISRVGYVASALVGLVYLFNSIFVNNGFDNYRIIQFFSNLPLFLSTLIKAITLMITMVVVTAPEGLPMMITVVLSANMKRMVKDNVLVKKLVGIETAGSMNILFTDKTGTLTVGRPQCDQFIYSFGKSRGLSDLRKTGEVYNLLLQSAKLNTDATLVGKEITGGNATDRAIYEFFLDCQCDDIKIKSRTPFSSERKLSSVMMENGKILIKGAAEIILASTRYAINKDGLKIPLDKEGIMQEYLEAVNRGERVVAVAFSEGEADELCFVSLICMKDKIRSGVIESVRQVQSAGIQVVMITGDGEGTAKSIAYECGIMSQRSNHLALSSEELGRMTDEQVKEIMNQLRVVYRALPQDKTRLVRLSQEMDMVVGMTGDGINDSPSIRLADVGFAMGSGTEIAKSASDIVILDNSFLSIAKTILYGRTIFKSIRKFITFQLTMNLAACGVSLLGQFFGIDTPITIIQMLWVNIIMDTLGGLAFAGEAPLEYYMREKPKSRNEQILSREMISQIGITGIYTLGLCILFLTSPVIRLMYGGLQPTEKYYTAFYVLFIFAGLFNCFLARSSRLWIFSNISKNKAFSLIMLIISVIQICMVYFGGEVFRCVPLAMKELSFVILLSSSILPFEMIRRLAFKLK